MRLQSLHSGDVLHRQKPVATDEPAQVAGETQQARIRLTYGFEIAGVEIVVPAIEVQLDAVIENRSEVKQIELALHHARKPVVGGPAIEEITLRGHALAVGLKEA